MKKFEVLYLPIGVPTFHLESANLAYEKSAELLKSLTEDLILPSAPLLSVDALRAFIEDAQPDLVILQNTTFANGAYAACVASQFDCPLLLWTLREPVIDGGRLRLNSLTGAYSAANAIRSLSPGDAAPYCYVYGNPEEKTVFEKIKAVIEAARCKFAMRALRMAAVGQTPQGFGFGRGLDADLQRVFGVELVSLEARELTEKAKRYQEEEITPYLQDAGKRISGLDAIPRQNRVDFARLYKAYAEYVKENNIGALATRCWPDFFTDYGTPVCAVLGILNDLGVAAACECDIYGALSMYLGMQLSGKPVFFGDPVSLDERENTLTFWHCGAAACSLARRDTGAQADKHCNRQIGPTLRFGCEAAPQVTIFRVGRDAKGKFRFFLAKGEALDKPLQFSGVSAVVRLTGDARKVVEQSVLDGWEPHFVVIYADKAEALAILANMLTIEVDAY